MDDKRKKDARRDEPSQEDIDTNSLLASGRAIPGPGSGHAREGHLPAHGDHSLLDELGLQPKEDKQ